MARNGSATFKSDNLSTISILEEFLTREATKKNVSLITTPSMNSIVIAISSHVADVNFDSVAYTLSRIHPKLEAQLMLAKKVELLPALEVRISYQYMMHGCTSLRLGPSVSPTHDPTSSQELKAQEGSSDFMTPEYLEIIGLLSDMGNLSSDDDRQRGSAQV
jgi:hypothetical protein